MTTVQQLTRLQSALLNLCWEEFGLETKVTTIVTEDMYWVSTLSVIILEKRLSSDSQSNLISRISGSWQRRPFSLSNDGSQVWATVLFSSAIMHRKDCMHVIFFFRFLFFFCHICRTSACWDPEILLPWQSDVTTFLSFKKGTCLPLVRLPQSLARNVLASPPAQTVFRNP